MIKAQKAASQRGFADRDVYMIVSSDPQTCTNGGGEIIPIPAANTGQVCASASFTISADVQESGKRSPSTFQGPLPIRLSLMIVTASAVNNVSHTYPAGVHFALTPEQALSSNITHEAMHVYLRLTGAPKSSAEEQSLQLIEKDLLSYYGLNPADRPIPIKFDR